MFANIKCAVILATIECCLAAVPVHRKHYKTFPVHTRNDTYHLKIMKDVKSGYTLIQVNQEGKMILLSTRQKATYFGASEICRDNSMDLIRVDSNEKHELVKEIIKKITKEGPFWMDGSRLVDAKVWRWSDDSLIRDVRWDKGEPNNAKGDEMCIELYHYEAVWDDQRCTERIYFICESSNNYDKGNLYSNIINIYKNKFEKI